MVKYGLCAIYWSNLADCVGCSQLGEKAVNFAGGACASLASQTLVVPLDIVSQRMMLAGQGVDAHTANCTRERARGLLAVAKQVYRMEGLRGFYRGYLPSIATYAPSSAIMWGFYGYLVPVYSSQLASWGAADPFWTQGVYLSIYLCISIYEHV